ncbi:hypothetical protein COLO4_09459 [Corchorus olitorius]|uniref:Uncharacterized protein n=1 Tax=Corchorus olitorius TaxID=93759 RepID=A0A1R3KC56_9ROSI|nr:hypothetical protein COLO4_09459 [Corchorus olitorius]
MELDEAWLEKIKRTEVNEESVQRIVADYLVREGHFSAAVEFYRSTGTAGNIGLRMMKTAIMQRNVERANELMQEYFTEEFFVATMPLLMQGLIDDFVRDGRLSVENKELLNKINTKIGVKDEEVSMEVKSILLLLLLPNRPLAGDDHREQTVRRLVTGMLAVKGENRTEPQLVSVLKKLVYLHNWYEGVGSTSA